MSFDGVFIHHLCRELRKSLVNTRINQINCINKSTFVLELANKENLLISLNADSSHFRLMQSDYIASDMTFPFLTALRKHLIASRIVDFHQIENDRIIVFIIEEHDSLGYKHAVRLIGEMFGRNANLILTDNDIIVIDCLKKTYVLTDNKKRIMVPKVKYQPPAIDRINPYKTDTIYERNIYQGVSNLTYGEIAYRNDLSFLTGPTKPVLIEKGKKSYFYCLDLSHLAGERKYFPNLSVLLEEYYHKIRKINIQNSEQKNLEYFLKKETAKAHGKLKKQKKEYKTAKQNLQLKQTGNLLSANLFKIKRRDTSVTVWDFYNNTERDIPLNPSLSPAQNMEKVFAKYKKAKRAIDHLETQIKNTENEIEYLKTLEEQVAWANRNDLREIMAEIMPKANKKKIKKNPKPQITTYKDRAGNLIMVGKNNHQNNYLTHTLARKNDYFFHVKGAPGSHTILRGTNPSADAIKLAATIAAYYSKMRLSANVAVDYTLVRYVKKVPKTKGSFVTYTKHKTIFVTPEITFIKNNTI